MWESVQGWDVGKCLGMRCGKVFRVVMWESVQGCDVGKVEELA